MILELHVADVVDDHKIKMDAMRMKIRKIRKYAIHTEAWYHYAVGSILPWLRLWSHMLLHWNVLHSFNVWFNYALESYMLFNENYVLTLCIYFFSNNIWSLLYFGFNVMMKSLCNRWVFVQSPDTSKEIVRFAHEVHPVFAATLSSF